MICNYCRQPLPYGAQRCPYCGAYVSYENMNPCPPTPSEPPYQGPTGLGNIHLHYDGNWMLFDAKIKLYANGYEIGRYSIKKPFDIDIPAPGSAMLSMKCIFRSAEINAYCGTGQAYVTLIYDRITGGFTFIQR